jgi:glyoxylase-like metal-dependent hydrolase (beta-lactamase superfamily II)/ferredoxin
MANIHKRLPLNVPGEFYVDSTCIDCGTCRHVAPASFDEGTDSSYVFHQPASSEEARQAMRALLSCPTASIGTEHPDPEAAKTAMGDFPLPVEGDVYYMGFASSQSYGASSYAIRRPDGNWLVDSPRYHPALFGKLAQWGGLARIFLTHQDDVADAARYAAHFKAERLIHEADAGAQPDAERRLAGEDPIEVAPGCLIIPTPGHTRGHCVLLVDDRYLFTGDHLWGEYAPGHAPEGASGHLLGASRGVCWYSWEAQIRSMERLLDYRFEWVLPGHGYSLHLEAEETRRELEALIKRMKGR